MTTPVPGLPAEIAAAIDDLVTAAEDMGASYDSSGFPALEREEVANEYRVTLDAAILSRLTAVEADRDEARADLHEAMHGQDAEGLLSWVVSATETRDCLERERDVALARAERLERSIRDFLAGDYPNPRSHRPGKCKHGIFYWEECGGCDCEHFEAAIAALATPTHPALPGGRSEEKA